MAQSQGSNQNNKQNYVVRVAPSPTGQLHLGHFKMYILNYAFAKKHKGRFILRIDDTDQARNKNDAIKGIIQDMEWFGIDYDNGPEVIKTVKDDTEEIHDIKQNEYYQSKRIEIYKKYLNKLLKEGKAFEAYETKEEREEQIKEQKVKKLPPIYMGGHENLTDEEKKQFIEEGRKPVIRLKVPLNKKIEFKDGVFGKIEVNTSSFGSFVIFRSDGYPMYNFASIIDDYEMGVTHVIRGRDHLSNTPKQIEILNQLGLKLPEFVHYTSILNESDKGKLSKRNGAKPIAMYRAEGYLPEAIFNYIVVISFSFSFAHKEQEIMTKKDIYEKVEISKLLKTNSKFNSAKLDWFNGQHLRRLSEEDFNKRYFEWLHHDAIKIDNFIQESSYTDIIKQFIDNKELVEQALPIVKERIVKFADTLDQLKFLFFAPVKANLEIEATKHSKEEFGTASAMLKKFIDSLEFPFVQENWEQGIRQIADELGWKHGDLFMALRLLIIGERFSPPLLDSMNLIGKNECLIRM